MTNTTCISYISVQKQKRRHRGDVMASIVDAKNTKDSILKVAKYAIQTFQTLKVKETELKERDRNLKQKDLFLEEKDRELTRVTTALGQRSQELTHKQSLLDKETKKAKELFAQSGGYTAALDLYCEGKSPADTGEPCVVYQLRTLYETEAVKLIGLCTLRKNTDEEGTARCTLLAKNFMKLMRDGSNLQYYKWVVLRIEKAVGSNTSIIETNCATIVPGFFECAWKIFYNNNRVVDIDDFPFKLDLNDTNDIKVWLNVFFETAYISYGKMNPNFELWKTGQGFDRTGMEQYKEIRKQMIYYYMVTNGYSIVIAKLYGLTASDGKFDNTPLKNITDLSSEIQDNYIWNQKFPFEDYTKEQLLSEYNKGTCEFMFYILYSMYKYKSETNVESKENPLYTRYIELKKQCFYLSTLVHEQTGQYSFPWRDKLLDVDGFLSWATEQMQEDEEFFNAFSRVIYENNTIQFSNGG